MGELRRLCYVEKIKGSCVRLEPLPGVSQCAPAGIGMSAIIIETHEGTPSSSFWKTAASCGRFEVVIRELS